MSVVHHSLWRDPAFEWSVSCGGLVLPPAATVVPGRDYLVRVVTLCGGEDVEIEATGKEAETVARFARRSQICASIHHVMRRACVKCRTAYQYQLTYAEKEYLYTSEPSLGPVLGMGHQEIRTTPEEDERWAQSIKDRAAASMAGTKMLADIAGKARGNG